MSKHKAFFQDPMTPMMYGMSELHDHILFFLFVILFVVMFIFISTLLEFYYPQSFPYPYPAEQVSMWYESYHKILKLPYDELMQISVTSGRTSEYYLKQEFLYMWSMLKSGVHMEMMWTIMPSLILLCMAIPSFALLYAIDEMQASYIFVKVMGHQWYWSYEVTGLAHVPYHMATFDSYMLADNDLLKGELSLLKTDNPLMLPKNTAVSILITSDDVLHSWALPSCGVKVDAVPGRLSQISLLFKTSGIFYGQCSELCGVNHGFMPMEVWMIDTYSFARLEQFLATSLTL